MSTLEHHLTDWVNAAIVWHDPYWWIALSLTLFATALLGVWPLQHHPEFSQGQAIAVVLRKALLALFLALLLWLFLVLSLIAGGESLHLIVAPHNALPWFHRMLGRYWTFPILGVVLGSLGIVVSRRYVAPYLSRWWRSLRVIQTGDQASDIRREITQYGTATYDPQTYYKADQLFFGLDQNGRPLYLDWETFRETHGQIIGPTRTGKGVLLGVLLDQMIRQNHTCFYIDPKRDAFIPSIMSAAAEASGRKFIYLDLNAEGPGYWAPFKGGSPRECRNRMISVFNLESRGTDADVYLAEERGVVDELVKLNPRSIGAMLDHMARNDLGDKARRLAEGLREWKEISTFSPGKGKGFNMRRSIESNAVVYVRGSIKDSTVKDATKAFIIELVQELGNPEIDRSHHVFTAIDEVRFVISNALVDALATVAGHHANIYTAYQSITDLRNSQDKSIDPRATEQSVNTNCQVKVLYRAVDADTAEWGEALSGTQQKIIPRFESTNVDAFGGETWNDTRMLNAVEEGLIPKNLLLALQNRVGVLYAPGQLAQVMRTAWVSVSKPYIPHTSHKQPALSSTEVDDAIEQPSAGEDAGDLSYSDLIAGREGS